MPSHTHAYSPAVAALLAEGKLNELGPLRPDEPLRPVLQALTPEAIVAPHPLGDRQMALACHAGLWLRHDFLDESHAISQRIETPTGSYWHGIMHRREGDFDNAKYWFRRVGRHPVYEPLGAEACELATRSDAREQAEPLADESQWDPFHFIDLCQRAAGRSSALSRLCREIQRREWCLLFEFCHARAIGR
jgi:hypothetical protein